MNINFKGQALIEFILVIPIFILLIFLLRDSINILTARMKVQEAARFAVWERAKGFDNFYIKNEIEKIANRSNIETDVNLPIKSFRIDPLSHGILKLSGLKKDGKISCTISLPVSSNILSQFQENYRLSSTQTIISDPWNSSSDHEMKERVSKIYLGGKYTWIQNGILSKIINIYEPRINPDALPIIKNQGR